MSLKPLDTAALKISIFIQGGVPAHMSTVGEPQQVGMDYPKPV
ncbi:MAG TPA: hypothetical protein VJ508_14690 [Saprospiraceae bacterium]|nr:hypothetical protein [Saprospiraceae bacterium]